MEGLLTGGFITFEDYVEMIPNESILPKLQLQELAKKHSKYRQIEEMNQQLMANQELMQQQLTAISTEYKNLAEAIPMAESVGRDFLAKMSGSDMGLSTPNPDKGLAP